jgi:hypothetical protein
VADPTIRHADSPSSSCLIPIDNPLCSICLPYHISFKEFVAAGMCIYFNSLQRKNDAV